MAEEPLVSILIPAYNRAGTLPRLLDSVLAQSYASWECLVIDDGSTDGTGEALDRYRESFGEKLSVLRQPHAGKPMAINRGIRGARGDFIVTVDSDDVLAPEALAILVSEWLSIPEGQRGEYAAVEGLCCDIQSGETIGVAPAAGYQDEGYLVGRYLGGGKGDRARMTNAGLLSCEEYPTFHGEWWMPTGFLWNRLGHFRVRFVNAHLIYKDYRPDGITAAKAYVRARNPKGGALHYQELVGHLWGCTGIPRREIIRAHANWIRHVVHGDKRIDRVVRSSPNRMLSAVALPVGVLLALNDRVKLRGQVQPGLQRAEGLGSEGGPAA